MIEAEYFGVRSALLDPQIDGGLWAGYYAGQIGRGAAKLLPCEASAIQEWISVSRTDPDRTLRGLPVPGAYVEFLEEIQGRRVSGSDL